MLLIDVARKAHEILSDGQWVHSWNSRYQETETRCAAGCGTHTYRSDLDQIQHMKGCDLVETLRELDLLVEALYAKEQATADTLDVEGILPEDPVEYCSRAWSERMRLLQASLTAQVTTAEQRAVKAEQALKELVGAAKEFGYADDRFRKILGKY